MPFDDQSGQYRYRCCRVCGHKDRHRIELALAAGQSDRKVAAEFRGVSRDTIRRHWQSHLSASRKSELIAGPGRFRDLVALAVAEDKSLIEYLAFVRSELVNLFLQARDRGLTHDAAAIAQRLLNTLEMIGRMNGEIRTAAGVVINNVNATSDGSTFIQMADPLIVRLQAGLLKALAPHPAARQDVIKMLAELEAEQPIGQGLNGRHGPPLAVSGPVLEATHA
jgi:hypothetical protein